MEPEGSLPHLHMSVICAYPELARSSPSPHIPLPEDPSSQYPPIYAWFSQVASSTQVFPTKPFIHLSSTPYTLHGPPISNVLYITYNK
jgi:hypothetical protein